MKQETKVVLGIILLSVVILVGGIFLLNKPQVQNSSNTVAVDPTLLVRDDSFKVATDSAKLTLIEFADFQCPACGQVHPMLKEILADYQGKVNFVFRNFPLSQHKNAVAAATFAEAAGKQGKFWQVHDFLYENQGKWSGSADPNSVFDEFARGLNINLDSLHDSEKDPLIAEKIKRDQGDALALDVNSTPTFFLLNSQDIKQESANAQKLPGVLTYDQFKSLLDGLLNK